MNIELSGQAFHELWEHLGLGVKPLALNVLPDGILESERREAEHHAVDELRRYGYGDRDGEDDLLGALQPLRRYERSYDIVYRFRDGDELPRHTGIVANQGNQATLAVYTGQTVRITTVANEDMSRAILNVVPEMKPGPGNGVSVRSAVLKEAGAEAGSSPRALVDALARRGVRREEANALSEMVGSKRLQYAQFGAATMDGLGKRTRMPMVTNCYSNAAGWFLMEENPRGAEPWTTFAPMDKQRMRLRVEDLFKGR
ncbi:ESX secretion-associated protein EspG [Allosaccharopolyspora coralli]|uniref:ESX secretion-associated protein EspG n=1 Tax=Allosaccharopolyspora coralli TaxID=2665642 RepID=A0A5Q3Q8C4_9PSEU|nr:ESX secretion-associated protein EspG [Allosaccharopolyspora coralli]QGK69686.1 ESX secretion-associated protein EspG [Allosaccharopolyspora coralli]